MKQLILLIILLFCSQVMGRSKLGFLRKDYFEGKIDSVRITFKLVNTAMPVEERELDTSITITNKDKFKSLMFIDNGKRKPCLCAYEGEIFYYYGTEIKCQMAFSISAEFIKPLVNGKAIGTRDMSIGSENFLRQIKEEIRDAIGRDWQ